MGNAWWGSTWPWNATGRCAPTPLVASPNPTFWGEGYVADDGVYREEVPVWYQDWYTGAYYNGETDEYFLPEEEEWRSWNQWESADDDQRATILAAWEKVAHLA